MKVTLVHSSKLIVQQAHRNWVRSKDWIATEVRLADSPSAAAGAQRRR